MVIVSIFFYHLGRRTVEKVRRRRITTAARRAENEIDSFNTYVASNCIMTRVKKYWLNI